MFFPPGGDDAARIGFRPSRVGGRPAVEVVGDETALAGHYGALRAALGAAMAASDPDAASGVAARTPDLPDGMVLRLDRTPSGAPRVRLAEQARDDLRLLGDAEAVGGVGSWELDAVTGVLRWSENLYRLYGFDPLLPIPTVETVVAALHPDDRERTTREVREMRERGEMPRPSTHRVVRPSGEVRHLRSTLGVAEFDDAGRPRRLVGSVQDITDRRRAEQEIALHVAVAEALAEWEGLEPGTQRLLARIGEAVDCVGGVLWVPEDDHMVPRVIWPDRVCRLQAYWAATRRTQVRRGVCVPGVAWDRGEPVLVDGGVGEDYGPRWEAAQEDGVRASLSIPALHGTEVVSVIELVFVDEWHIGERLMRSLTGIGHELGQFLGRRRGQLEASRLTARELEVLQLASQGMTTRGTADALYVSPATVKTHLANIYEKLGAADRAAAVASAMRLGLIR